MMQRRGSLFAVAIISTFVLAFQARAETAADFYRHTTLRLIVSSSAGGGYDAMARLVARWMSQYLPGNPSIVVENMPGAGGVIAVNSLANVALRDGSTFALLDRGVMTARILYGDDSKTQFDPRKLLWLGSVTKEAGVGMASSVSGIKSLDDARKRDVVIGATGVETDPAMYARLLNSLFGTRFKVIPGYGGETEMLKAMVDQNETDGMFTSGWSGPNTVKELDDYHAGKLVYFLQMARQRLPEIPDTPTILDLLTHEEDRQIVNILLTRLSLGTPFLTPPDVPADRLEALRAAFRSTVADADFRKAVEQQYNHVDATFPADAEQQIAAVLATPDSVVQRLRGIVKIGP